VAIWQDEPWYIVAVYGALMGFLLQALRRDSVRRKVAKSMASKSTS
jgi:hypothetical protein